MWLTFSIKGMDRWECKDYKDIRVNREFKVHKEIKVIKVVKVKKGSKVIILL